MYHDISWYMLHMLYMLDMLYAMISWYMLYIMIYALCAQVSPAIWCIRECKTASSKAHESSYLANVRSLETSLELGVEKTIFSDSRNNIEHSDPRFKWTIKHMIKRGQPSYMVHPSSVKPLRAKLISSERTFARKFVRKLVQKNDPFRHWLFVWRFLFASFCRF